MLDLARPRVILASASPRRHGLLDMIGIHHEVCPTNVDETYVAGEWPVAHAERLARAKAAAIGETDAVVIGSDTVVVVDGDVLGKPRDSDDAERMLRRLSGRSHVVMTGVAVRWRERSVSGVEEVAVTFRALADDEIRAYIATGEPMDKAGSYGIQGYGATLVERVDGDYFAVMGLALNRMVRLMESLGLEYRFAAVQRGRG